jgi:hypothetical protein
MRPSSFVLVPLFLACAWPVRADDAAQAEAQLRFQEGLSLHDAGKDEEARLKFQQAYALHPSPAALFNLARAEMLVARHVDAAAHFRAFVKMAPHPKIDAESLARAQAFLAELDKVVSRIVVEAPADAVVTIDGKVSDTRDVVVSPGVHTVEVARAGAALARKEVLCENGRTQSVRVEAGAPAPAKAAEATTSGDPGSAKPWVAGGVGALGLASLAVGIGFAVGAGNAGDRASDAARRAPADCTGRAEPACVELAEASRDRASDANLRTGFLITGGVLVLGAVVTWLAWPSAKGHAAARATARGAGGAVEIRF